MVTFTFFTPPKNFFLLYAILHLTFGDTVFVSKKNMGGRKKFVRPLSREL